MDNYHSLSMDDKTLINDYYYRRNYLNSELSFSTLWLWRHAWPNMIKFSGDTLFVIEKRAGEDGHYYALPAVPADGNLVKAIDEVKGDLSKMGSPFMMRSVTAQYKQEVERLAPGRFLFEPDEGFFDYIYNSSDLRELPGRKYAQKRNHIGRFLEFYNYEYRRIKTEKDKLMCLEMYGEWRENKDMDVNLHREFTMVEKALREMEALDLTGAMVIIKDKVEAFTVAEVRRSDAIVHIEKANPEIMGLYAFINQHFAQEELAGVEFINREEDIGLENLRRAKQSYHPAHMLEKYVMTQA